MPDETFRSIDPIDPRARPLDSSGSGFAWLRRDGIQLRSPQDIGRDQIRGCLWELIYGLAARHIFLSNTNHLDDLQLYSWLHDQWLANSNDRIWLNPEGTHRVDVVGSGSEADNDVWLRFYADEVVRDIWSRDFPEDSVPPSEAAPFDRDRWLPHPPPSPVSENLEAADFSAEDGSACGNQTPFDELHDPLHLEAVDREIHRSGPSFELEETDDGREGFGQPDPTEFTDDLLREPAVGVETDCWRNPHVELTASGIILPPPEELTDEALPAKLWELFHELACYGFYLLHTDHLSDRELYTKLWRENLHEPAILPGPASGGGWYHDFIGNDSPEAVFQWLRYYANDLEREKHVLENPEFSLPPREKCPYCRDHRLPKGPF